MLPTHWGQVNPRENMALGFPPTVCYLYNMVMKFALLPRAAVVSLSLLLASHAGARDKDRPTAGSPASNLELARQLSQAFVQVAEQVTPSVVVIKVVQKANPAHKNPHGSPDDEPEGMDSLPPELRDYFRRHFQAPEGPSVGQGSGIIIREDGYILTNGHVIEDASKIEVSLQDGRTFRATVRGNDAPSDIAVIKIEAKGLPVAKLADSSKTRVGEFAIAIGAPFALDYSVTFGHVSAKDRAGVLDPSEGSAMMDQAFIQTDANINPGNSGGPLVNIEGEVIGVNSLIHGLHTGIGFAVPINLAREVADKLISDGKFTRAWLGVAIRGLGEYPEFRDLVPDVKAGVVIEGIVPDGPAAKSKLQPEDVITSVDGHPVSTVQGLKNEVRGKALGKDISLDVYRPELKKHIKVAVKPGEWIDPATVAAADASEAAAAGNAGEFGLKIKALTSELANQMGIEKTDGVVVTSVDRKGLAAQSDIKPGDIITSINHQATTTPKQFHDTVRKANPKKGVIIKLITDGVARFEILKEEEK